MFARSRSSVSSTWRLCSTAWLAARRSGHALLSALAYPAMGLFLLTLMLAYSRGALVALALGLALWFSIVPLRLRGAAVLFVGALAAGAVVAWDFSQDARGYTNGIALAWVNPAWALRLGTFQMPATAGGVHLAGDWPRSRGDQIAITEGVKAGDEVVTSGVFKLRNGAAVQVNNKVRPGNNPKPKPENS